MLIRINDRTINTDWIAETRFFEERVSDQKDKDEEGTEVGTKIPAMLHIILGLIQPNPFPHAGEERYHLRELRFRGEEAVALDAAIGEHSYCVSIFEDGSIIRSGLPGPADE